MPQLPLDLSENLRNMAVHLSTSAHSGDQALGIMRLLSSWNDVQLRIKLFSNPINSLKLQNISTLYRGIKQGYYEVLDCMKCLKERERHISDITLLMKSSAFGQVKPNGDLKSALYFVHFLLFPHSLIFVYFSFILTRN